MNICLNAVHLPGWIAYLIKNFNGKIYFFQKENRFIFNTHF